MHSLTQKMVDFCYAYVELRNAKQSAERAGYSDEYARSRAHLLLKDSRVQNKITDIEDSYYQDEFKKLARKSVFIIDEILDANENRTTQLRAAELCLKLAGVQKNDISVETEASSVKIKVTLPDGL